MICKNNVMFRKFNFELDIEQVCEYHKDHIKINFPGTKFKETLFKSQVKAEYDKEPEGMFIMVDTKNSKDIGFLWLNTKEDIYMEKLYGDIHYIHLVPEYRGQGIGKQIMKKIESYFKSKKVTELRLGTHADNTASLKLYFGSGYVPYRITLVKILK